MEITLFNHSLGERTCNTIKEAEILSASCVSHITVTTKNHGETLIFTFDPAIEGFADALMSNRAKVQNKKSGVPSTTQGPKFLN